MNSPTSCPLTRWAAPALLFVGFAGSFSIQGDTHWAESEIFPIDTRQTSPSRGGWAESALFTIDTRGPEATPRHPADTDPPDNRLNISEVTAYGAAWRLGDSWPIEPNPIPIHYVTRAGTLSKNGESYEVDPGVSAPPLWWVNVSGVNASPGGAGHWAEGSLPERFVPGELFVVQIRVRPGADSSVYAVEDQVPAGWPVSDISHGGQFDPNNHRVKWGPYFDDEERLLRYQIEPLAEGVREVVFTGEASFDGAGLAVSGPRTTRASSRLGTFQWLEGGIIQMEIRGQPGANYVIEVSTDVKEWRRLEVAPLLNGTVTFVDPDHANRRQGYYRAVQE